MLHSVKKHLLPNGQFIFDTQNPNIDELSAIQEYTTSYVNHDNQTIEEHLEKYHHQTQILHCQTDTGVFENNHLTHTENDTISLRFIYPMELLRLLDL
ncbi:MAG: hypothetical protein Q4Q13_04875, partial [Vagococcus sp.]|nr:hypothetical protein [Vagococcus sp.]